MKIRDFFRKPQNAVTSETTRPEPLWAAAARAAADGRLGPWPRLPTVRPESDYEMHMPGHPDYAQR